MQHLYNHETDFYSSTSTGTHLHPMNTHPFPYQHESPPQSSNSDVEERTSTPPVSSSSSSTQIHSKNGTNKIVKKKKQTKKKRKDPNEPQKPVSPYALFFRDTQNDIKKKLANPSFGEISKVVAHMWENIEPEVKEQYKRKAATAKKEYLKQLAAYRAIQVSQSATSSSMHPHPSFDPSASHHSTPLITENNNLLSSSHHSNNFPSYHPAPASASMQAYAPSLSHPPSQFNNYNYLPNYPNDPSAMHYSNPYSNYSSYDSNNNFGDHGTSNSATGTHYGLLRPAIDSSEIYSSNYYSNPNESNLINENLLQNLNHSSIHYTDLSTGTHSHPSMEKHYDYLPPTLNELDHPTKDDPSAPSNSHFHWNSTTCLATQW